MLHKSRISTSEDVSMHCAHLGYMGMCVIARVCLCLPFVYEHANVGEHVNVCNHAHVCACM